MDTSQCAVLPGFSGYCVLCLHFPLMGVYKTPISVPPPGEKRNDRCSSTYKGAHANVSTSIKGHYKAKPGEWVKKLWFLYAVEFYTA